MSREEFIQQYRASVQAFNRRGWILLALLLVFTIACGILIQQVLMPLAEEGYLDWAPYFVLYSAKGIAGCLFLLLAFALSRPIESCGFRCPACGNVPSARLTVITGNCGHCGEKILDDKGPCIAEMLKSLRLHD